MWSLDSLSHDLPVGVWAPTVTAQARPCLVGRVSRNQPLNPAAQEWYEILQGLDLFMVSVSLIFWLLVLILHFKSFLVTQDNSSNPPLHSFMHPRASPSSYCINFSVQLPVPVFYIKPKQLSYSLTKTIMTNFWYPVFHNLNILLYLFSLLPPQNIFVFYIFPEDLTSNTSQEVGK